MNYAGAFAVIGAIVVASSGCGGDEDTGKADDSPVQDGPRMATPPANEEFAPPLHGSERVELMLEAFDLEPGAETYKCQTFQNPFGKNVAVLQAQSRMTRGSHHLAVFRVEDNADRAIEDCSGLEFHATIHSAQTPIGKTTYPDGVGAFLSGAEGVRLNAHYVNLTESAIHAEVRVAIDYSDPESVEFTAAQIYLNDSRLDIPPGRGSAGGSIALPEQLNDIKLISGQSHMHRRGVEFHAMFEDGTPIYASDTWSEPPMKAYAPPLPLADVAAIAWQCEYENETDGHLKFGESADTDEMCVFTGFYYPAPQGQMLVGDTGLDTVARLFK